MSKFTNLNNLRSSIFPVLLQAVLTVSHFDFRITDWLACDTVATPFLTGWNIPLRECVETCVRRERCSAISYDRPRKKCGLLDSQQTDANTTLFSNRSSCVYIAKTDMIMSEEFKDRCNTCISNQTCSEPSSSCNYTECHPLEIANTQIYGNMIKTGAHVWIIANTEYYLSSNTSLSTCREDGAWSNIPTALKPCPDGWHKLEQECYKLITEKYTYIDALALCTLFDGHVVTLESSEESETLRNLIQTLHGSLTFWWIGIDDRTTEGVWVYTNTGEAITYSDWRPGEPNNSNEEECALLENANTVWADVHCTRTEKVICEKRARDPWS